MNILGVIKLSWGLLRLRSLPSDMPYAITKILTILLVSFLSNICLQLLMIDVVNYINLTSPSSSGNNIELFHLTVVQAFIVSLVSIITLIIFLYIVLSFKQILNRFEQVLLSILVVDIFMTVLYSISLFIFYYIPFLSFILFILLLYWNFTVLMYIFAKSIEIKNVSSGLLTLFYMLIQHNITEMVLGYFVTKGQG